VILAHHAGEDLILTLVASGASGVSVLAAVMRARISGFVHRIRKR
jgi:hypothetical protein